MNIKTGSELEAEITADPARTAEWSKADWNRWSSWQNDQRLAKLGAAAPAPVVSAAPPPVGEPGSLQWCAQHIPAPRPEEIPNGTCSPLDSILPMLGLSTAYMRAGNAGGAVLAAARIAALSTRQTVEDAKREQILRESGENGLKAHLASVREVVEPPAPPTDFQKACAIARDVEAKALRDLADDVHHGRAFASTLGMELTRRRRERANAHQMAHISSMNMNNSFNAPIPPDPVPQIAASTVLWIPVATSQLAEWLTDHGYHKVQR